MGDISDVCRSGFEPEYVGRFATARESCVKYAGKLRGTAIAARVLFRMTFMVADLCLWIYLAK